MSLLDLKKNLDDKPSVLYIELVKKFLTDYDFYDKTKYENILVDIDKNDIYLDFKKPEKIFIVLNKKEYNNLHYRILSFRQMNEIGWIGQWAIVYNKLYGKGLNSLLLEDILKYECTGL